MEELISRISRKISEVEDGEILATKLVFGYVYGQIKRRKDKKSMHIYRYGWLLPFLKRILWSGRYPNNSPGTDR